MKQKLTDGTALLWSLLAVDPSKKISSAESASYSCCLLWVGFPFSPTCCPRTFALPLSFCPSLSFWPPSAFSPLQFCPLLSFRLLCFLILTPCRFLNITFTALQYFAFYCRLASSGYLAGFRRCSMFLAGMLNSNNATPSRSVLSTEWYPCSGQLNSRSRHAFVLACFVGELYII